MNLFVGLACSDLIHVRTALCLAAAVRALDCPLSLNAERGPYVHHGRERLLEKALDSDATHLMFVDSDMVFPVDGIARLMGLRKGVVGAHYNTRGVLPPVSAVKPFGNGGFRLDRPPFKVDAVPTGFMLIDLEKVRDVPRPWFWFDHAEDGDLVGEDVFFCRRVREHGVDVWCDPRIKVEHLGEFAF